MRDRSGGEPVFTDERLLLVASGAIVVSVLPYWVNWLRITYPALELRIVLTRTASRFVSSESLTAISGSPVRIDDWAGSPASGQSHMELAEWCDVAAVYPATANFITRFALGFADSPGLMALQCTTARVGVAPALPPGWESNPAWRRNLGLLTERTNVFVASMVGGRSVSATSPEVADARSPGVPLPMPDFIPLLEAHHFASPRERG